MRAISEIQTIGEILSARPVYQSKRRICFSLLVAVWCFASIHVSAQEIWIWGSPNVVHPVPGWEKVRPDKGEMWKADAPWQTVAGAVSVVQFPPGNVERASDSDLQQALADIKLRHLALAIGTGMLIRSDRCRSKSEAYVDRESLERLFGKLRRDGADLKYVTMDEPYFYGHKESGPTACHESARTLAMALKESVAIVRNYFPDVQIGTDEVVTNDRSWVDELAAWADAYQQGTGEKLAYLHADLGWKQDSVQNLVPLRKALNSRGIPLGVTYDAAAKGDEPWFDANSELASNIGWVRNAVSHYTKVETLLGGPPDQAVFGTWVHYPTRVLPENEPETLTNAVLQYIQQHKKPTHRAESAGATTPEVWFFLRGYNVSPQGVDGRQGWQRLFLDSDTPWPQFMDHVQVVAFAGNIKTVPDDVLAKTFTKLKEKHIGFAVESLALSWVGFNEGCGKGVESYTDPPGNAQIARRIKAAGGELAYVTMDGPLSAGHYYNGPNACHDSINKVADRAAAIMREYHKVFPNVMIGDTEPIPSLTKHPHWREDYQEWMQAFQKAFGKPIAFVNFDVNWPEDNQHWQQSLPQATEFARTNHLPFGIIYNTSIPGGAKSDERWLDSAAHNFQKVETDLQIIPDKALFESWAYFPKRSITDANGPGEDYLVKQYLQLHERR